VREIAVLGVPSSLGAHAPGQERAPAALRRAGLLDALAHRGLKVDDLGDLPVRRWTPDRSSPHAQHAGAVAGVAREVAEVVATASAVPRPILVLGGDCTIELGVVSGLLQGGAEVALVYLDAGCDLNVPTSVREGFLDWMGMGHALDLPGAADAVRQLGPRTPLLRPEHVAFVGVVPDELTEWERQQVNDLSLRVQWADDVAADPPAAAGAAVTTSGNERVAVHFDVDVVDFLDFPAADFATINAGLTLEQAMTFLGEIVRHPRFSALTVCEVNPNHLDENGEQIRAFAERLADIVSFSDSAQVGQAPTA
jgi:arginase